MRKYVVRKYVVRKYVVRKYVVCKYVVRKYVVLLRGLSKHTSKLLAAKVGAAASMSWLTNSTPKEAPLMEAPLLEAPLSNTRAMLCKEGESVRGDKAFLGRPL